MPINIPGTITAESSRRKEPLWHTWDDKVGILAVKLADKCMFTFSSAWVHTVVLRTPLPDALRDNSDLFAWRHGVLGPCKLRSFASTKARVQP